jgi:hypothetical protein
MLTGDKRSERPAGQSLWRGVILFALGVIGLSSFEVWLVVRLPNWTGADYVSLTSDLTPVLRQEMSDMSANVSMRHGLIDARSEGEKGAAWERCGAS